MDKHLHYQHRPAEPALTDFVESYWYLCNDTTQDKEVILLPDGRVDLICCQVPQMPFQVLLLGIDTQPDQLVLKAGTKMAALSFKLPAVEYIFRDTVAELLNHARLLPEGFWDFDARDLQDFGLFCQKAYQKIVSLLPKETDPRKQELFTLIYASAGAIPVKTLSEKVFWSSRQINRYFHQQFGLSLKAYCDILRFRASFPHIKAGRLFPEQNFADQSHFIKAVKKLSGVLPKALKQNQNDRFIQFSTLLPE
ncbi:MAG: AraC family transcriptional regulator [Sphingobacteriales bacterium]|nr:MAG: AraC family transcriptional regulator [Sphingobacteriales bacterium]